MQIEKQKENDIYIKRELITAASVLLPACMMLFVESMARGSVKLTIDWIVANPMVAFINYAVWFIPFNLFQFISRRWLFWTCQLILTGLVLCIGVGNAVKLQVRTTPFVLQDLSVLDAAVTMAEDYFPEWNLPLLLVCAVLAVVAFAIVVGRRFNRYAVGKTRWVLFSMIFCCMLFYTTEKDAFWAEGYSLKNNYENNGFADGFLRSAAENYQCCQKATGVLFSCG